MKAHSIDLTQDLIKEVFEYKDGKLFNKMKRNGAKRGKESGTLDISNGYRKVSINKKQYYAHRIIWFLFNGEISKGLQVDHINGKRDDNKIENLRIVTDRENKLNMGKSKNNKSGVTGVSWSSDRKKWVVVIWNNNKIITLGRFDNFNDAVRVRKKAEKKYKYHENHGRD